MPDQRIKGQEVEVVVIVDGVPQDSLTAAKSLELSFETEMIQEGYLGETTDRFDSIFKGIKGKVEFHFATAAVFNLIRAVVNKARRRTPGVKVNIKATLNFPRGQRARVIVRDVEFGPMPVNFGSRSDYGAFSLEYGASEAQVLAA